MEFNYLQRVKVYRLNDEGKWDDKGTGHVSIEYLERSDAVGLVVIDEEDNQTLLVHRISADDIYRRQEDTIISWTDPEVATDLALSFQETMGCTFIWDQICSVQRSIHFPSVAGFDSSGRPGGDDLDHSGTFQDDGGGTEAFELPPVELSTLPQIAKVVGEVLPFDKDRVASMVVHDKNYIRKLVEMFRTCDDLENVEGLHVMFKIVKGIISLNDGHIFDIIFSDDYIMDIVGALEYDPDMITRQNHRAYLKEQVVFKEAVPIHDPAILSKIHQTYRIGYIKDVILPRVLDDQTFATMNSIMLFNNVSVVSALQNDSDFLSGLFSRFRSPEITENSKRDLVFFVQEFCNLSKHLQPGVRSQLFSALAKEGLFDILKDILKNTEESVRLSCCDILIVILNNDPTLLRNFLVQQTNHSLFSELVSGMLTPSEGGLQAQLLEIMRMLLDSETMDGPQVEKSPFLEVFYEKYMDQMVEVLTSSCPPEVGIGESSRDLANDTQNQAGRLVSPEILGNICDLLCFCVQHHRFRIKYYVMRKHVVEKVLQLTRRKEKYLVVAAVRFIRTCISLKEEFYYRYIVKNNCFEPIISAFVANGNRYNLLNSAVLELIECIRKDGIKSLIVHLIETYSSKLETIDYVNTFQALKLKYDQMMETPSGFSGGNIINSGLHPGPRSNLEGVGQVGLAECRKRKDDRALDKDEEDYFNGDSDDDEDTSTAKSKASSSPKLMHAGSLNKNGVPGQKSPSDEEDTASARLRVSAGRQPTKAVILVSKYHVSYRGNMFGLVDYDDEEDDMPMPTSVSVTDPALSNSEDATIVKRKSPPPQDLDQYDAVVSKRQKPEKAQVNEDAYGKNDVTCNDNSHDTAPTELDAEIQGSAEMIRKCSQVSSSSESTASRSDDVKIFPVEELGVAELPGNGIFTDEKTSDANSRSAIKLNHAGGGVSGSNNGTERGVIDSCSNGQIKTLPQSADIPALVENETDNTVNGGTNLVIDQTSVHESELSTPPGHYDSQRLQNAPGSLTRVADENIDDSRVTTEEIVCNTTAENCTGDDEICNGTAFEGVEVVDHGNGFIKDTMAMNVATQLLNNGSLDNESKKISGLGTDIIRAVTPTSPEPYTVR